MLKDKSGSTGGELSEKVTCEISLLPVDNRRLMNLCGHLNEHLHQIEQRLGVEIHTRGSVFQILGDKEAVLIAHHSIKKLYAQTDLEAVLTPEKVHLFLQESLQQPPRSSPDQISIQVRKGFIHPRSKNQRAYVEKIFSHDVNFGIGPAGTGKTYLAVASAVAALDTEKVKRIILVRPAVEAGEHLGFLPGDLNQKIDPYLKPLYDALHEMLGAERVGKLLQRNTIELAPLAYMRGRTLNDAFIILDEGQNTTQKQMKMFLTRLGFGSTAVITGDITQIDLPKDVISGLKDAVKVLKGLSEVSFTFFESTDVVRHPIVQKIITAYEKKENL